MPQQPATGPRSPSPSLLFVPVGILLWVGGVVAGKLGHSALAVEIRWSGIALLLPAAAQRSSLLPWTFLAMVAGGEAGADFPQLAVPAHFVGEIFLRLVRLLVAPLLVATITTGIAAHSRLGSLARLAWKSFFYFEVVTTCGLLLGAGVMDLSGAGWGMPVPVQSMSASPTGTEMVRRGLLHSMVRSQILQIAVFSLLLGVALALLPEGKRLPWLKLLQALGGTMFRLTRVIMYLAPLAAGAALTYTVGSMGLGTLFALVKLVATYYATLAVFCLGFLIPILAVFRIPLAGFVAAVREPAAIGLATTSSEAALPLAMERMEEFGVPRWIVSFVVPLGYSFNMDGSSVYLSMAAVFAAQAAGIHLSFPRQLAMLATLMLASKGVAGVPRAVLMVLLVTASAIHIPTPPVLLLLGVDTLMDMGRTMMNVVGNCMACAVIARSEGIVVGHRATPTRDFNLPPG